MPIDYEHPKQEEHQKAKDAANAEEDGAGAEGHRNSSEIGHNAVENEHVLLEEGVPALGDEEGEDEDQGEPEGHEQGLEEEGG